MATSIIHCDPEIQGGIPVFCGTRVPVKNLFDYLEAGDTLENFLHSFPRCRASKRSRYSKLAAKRSLPMRVEPKDNLAHGQSPVEARQNM